MDSKQFITRLSKKSGMDYRETSALLQSMISLMGEKMAEGNSIAIPGFGTFSTEKLDEKITVDLSSGKRILLPPQINVTFSQSAILSKHLDK